MNILDILMADENRSALDTLSKNFNLSQSETKNAVQELIPALTRGIQKNTDQPAGLDELLDALKTGGHNQYVDQPDILSKPATTKDGNDILGHIFGTKEVSRNVAKRASQNSGISSTLLKKMLPVVASLVMGALSKKLIGGGRSASRADTGIIGSLLDSDGDGAIWDDLLGMGAKALLR